MQPADLLIEHGVLVSMDPSRRVFADGALAIEAGRIVAIGPWSEVVGGWAAPRRLDVDGKVVLPGLINAHVHITGLDLFPGLEPVDSPAATHLATWALPSHVHATPDDERATARYLGLQMLRQGITAFIEAATIRFPAAVLDGLAELGLRGAIGTWTWDRWDEPAAFRTSTQAAVHRLQAALDLAPRDGRVQMWPTLIGHTSCSDELWRAAAALAVERDSHWSFHMSPGTSDGQHFRAQTGLDPLVHLDRLGVIDERAVVAHAIHVSDAEIEVLNRTGATVAFCPAASLHHGSGVTRAARHPELRHVALGTDSPHRLPLLQAAGLACSLFGDTYADRTALRPERALEWLTLAGARALGAEDRLGSLEVGKRADLAVFEVAQPLYNVAAGLVQHAVTGRALHVLIDGQPVVQDGHVRGEDAILAEAVAAGRRLGRAAGFPERTGWPLIGG